MQTKYGLPEQVLFCKKCVVSNQRPSSTVEYSHTAESAKATIHFDDEGVCDACRVAEAKAGTDWAARRAELEELCNRFRSKDGSYDCIAPGSGGKDSFYAAHQLKHEFGMHPLCVTWAPHIYTDWGRRNYQRWLDAGFTGHLVTPDPLVHRLLTRLAIENLFHPFQPFIVGQKALAPKLAKLFGIPLVFYGENEAEYGNPQQWNTAKRSGMFHAPKPVDLCLSGVPIRQLKSDYGLTASDLDPYMPMTDASRIEVHYLGYYLKWHPQSCYYYSVEHGGFEASPERSPGSYSKYNSIDDRIDDFHYWTTYQKFGIGRATYDAAQEIRSGDITREEGVALVHKFDGEFPERFETDVNEYLSLKGFEPMTRERWYALAEKFRSPHLWDGDKLRYRVQ